MKRIVRILLVVLLLLVVAGVLAYAFGREKAEVPIAELMGPKPRLTEPKSPLIPTVAVATPDVWRAGEKPVAPAGMAVQQFAAGLDHPRWMLLLPNGDILVAETNAPPKPEGSGGGIKSWVQGLVMKRAGARTPSANRITLLRDADGDGVAESRSAFLTGLYSPFGMALVGDRLYVADADKLIRFPYQPGQTKITAPAEKVADLPAGINHHWTKGLVASPDGAKLYVAVGSNSNIAERGMAAEKDRAAVLEIDAATGAKRVFAYGLRNPVGMAWEPASKALWTVVNERDEIGSDLVPDYLTHVEFGGFYGWPWFYWGGYTDTRVPDADLDQRQYVIRPDYALGPHTASLGLAFADQVRLGGRFAEGAFIGQHGSWNRTPKSGYKVIFVPFRGGRPAGPPVDVLTGFLRSEDKVAGRPVGVIGDKSGALLVADDVGNRIWRVSPAQATASR
ncbi:sorbosone dehydrogenase family protein [Sphingomonas sp. 1P06PA]|uniref:PQQ-dependent sugar dehydrogenase n=1 Tax=Sphingomonas sp. 1P06PA TaxID=554121 RepID=UPI0039A714A7